MKERHTRQAAWNALPEEERELALDHEYDYLTTTERVMRQIMRDNVMLHRIELDASPFWNAATIPLEAKEEQDG